MEDYEDYDFSETTLRELMDYFGFKHETSVRPFLQRLHFDLVKGGRMYSLYGIDDFMCTRYKP